MAMPNEKPSTEAEKQRAEHYARKQKWKELPGNRYTADELRRMAAEFGEFTIVKRRTKVMHID